MLSDSNHDSDYSEFCSGIIRGADSLRKRRDVYGATVRFPFGDTMVQDNAGGIIVKDRTGRITKTIDHNDKETKYEHDAQGNLVRLELPTGERFSKIENQRFWFRLHPDSILERTSKRFSVLSDGTLRVTCHTTKGTVYHQDSRLDSSKLVINEFGRITQLETNLEVQILRLYNVLDNLTRERRIKSEQRQGACDALHALLRRVALDEIASQQAAQTIFHICRLLEMSTSSPLAVQSSYVLAREILHFAALPDECDSSDGLCMLIGELYRKAPEQVANLVADMGVRGSYSTMTGVAVDYVDELMHPIARRMNEWTVPENLEESVESNRFLRVVLVNIIQKSRFERVVATGADARRSLSTREFGMVRERELLDLFEQITGQRATGVMLRRRPEKSKVIDRADVFGAQKKTDMRLA